MTDESTSLSWDVHVAPSEPLHASDLAPGEEAPFWSPISATLISGERDAVLVDALLTVGQAHDLVEWMTGTERTSRPCTSRTVTGITGSGWARSSIAFLMLERSRSPLSSSKCGLGPRRSSSSHSGRRASMASFRENSYSRSHSKTTRSTSRATSSSWSSSANRHRPDELPARPRHRPRRRRRRRLQRRSPLPRRVRPSGTARVDRRARHDRVSAPAGGDRRAPASRPPRRPRDHRGDPAVHPRLRPDRRDNQHGPRPLRPGHRALSRPHQPGRTLALGPGRETVARKPVVRTDLPDELRPPARHKRVSHAAAAEMLASRDPVLAGLIAAAGPIRIGRRTGIAFRRPRRGDRLPAARRCGRASDPRPSGRRARRRRAARSAARALGRDAPSGRPVRQQGSLAARPRGQGARRNGRPFAPRPVPPIG